jgi:hypothetical protein
VAATPVTFLVVVSKLTVPVAVTPPGRLGAEKMTVVALE